MLRHSAEFSFKGRGTACHRFKEMERDPSEKEKKVAFMMRHHEPCLCGERLGSPVGPSIYQKRIGVARWPPQHTVS